MNKKSFFAVLFTSWIFGISLICLFPPVPDYHVPDQNSGHLSQDAFPEIHQRNASQTGLFKLDFGSELVGSLVEFKSFQNFRFSSVADSISSFSQISALFNTWILFKAFFETW
jgi:hypothetical protein